MMTAKDLIIDFLNYAFLILLSVFFLFYVVFGNRLDFFKELMEALMPFSLFGILFLVVLRVRLKNIKTYKHEEILNEDIINYTRNDRKKDLLVKLGLPFILLFIASFDRSLNEIDFAQAGLVLIICLLWHRLLFGPLRKFSSGSFTRLDRIKDELFIYLTPLAVISIAALNIHVDSVDILQSLTAFAALFSWHLILFKK